MMLTLGKSCKFLTIGISVAITLRIFESKEFKDLEDEDWSKYFETNVMSGVRLAKAVLPGMLKRNEGTILFVSSEAAFGK